MKEKIFQALKQAYSHLGLGDAVLSDQAESLASTNLVTDENLQSVVDAQKGFLTSLQRANDKRVQDALEKAKKEAEEKAAKEAAEKAAAEEAARKAAEEEAARKKAEEEEAARRKALEDDKNIPEGVKKLIAEQQAAILAQKQAAEEQAKLFREQMEQMTAQFKTQSDSLTALRDENDKFKAAEALKARNAMILNKATEFGIPQWRIEEGFNIAAEADEAAIIEHLTKVANNSKANNLPGDKSHQFNLGDDKPTKEEMDSIAKGLV